MSDQSPAVKAKATNHSTRREFLGNSAKAALALGAGGALASLAEACAPFGSNVSSGPTTIKMQSWFWWEPGRADAWRAMIKKFHAAQNQVRIEEAGWPGDQFPTKILVQVQSGNLDGDLVSTLPDLFPRLVKAQLLEPLDEVISRAGLSAAPGRDPKAPNSLSPAHDTLKQNGHLYGLDEVTVTFGLLYNPKLYANAGITSPPTTIDEWIDASRRLTHRPDRFGMYSAQSGPGFWFWLQDWVNAYDGVWAKGKTPMVTSQPVINALKLFKTMYDVAMPQGADDATAIPLFVDGRVAQWLIVSAAVGVLKKEGPQIYPIVRSAAPPWPSRKTNVRIHPIIINAKSDKKDAAKTFLEWLYKPENYSQLLEGALDVIPAFPAGIRKEYLDSLPWTSGFNAGVQVTLPEIMGDFIFNGDEFGKILTTNFQPALTGSKPIEEAMAKAQTELEALAQRL